MNDRFSAIKTVRLPNDPTMQCKSIIISEKRQCKRNASKSFPLPGYCTRHANILLARSKKSILNCLPHELFEGIINCLNTQERLRLAATCKLLQVEVERFKLPRQGVDFLQAVFNSNINTLKEFFALNKYIPSACSETSIEDLGVFTRCTLREDIYLYKIIIYSGKNSITLHKNGNGEYIQTTFVFSDKFAVNEYTLSRLLCTQPIDLLTKVLCGCLPDSPGCVKCDLPMHCCHRENENGACKNPGTAQCREPL